MEQCSAIVVFNTRVNGLAQRHQFYRTCRRTQIDRFVVSYELLPKYHLAYRPVNNVNWGIIYFDVRRAHNGYSCVAVTSSFSLFGLSSGTRVDTSAIRAKVLQHTVCVTAPFMSMTNHYERLCESAAARRRLDL